MKQQHVCIQFYSEVRKNITVLTIAFGKQTVGVTWFPKFKVGMASVEDVEYFGSPLMSKTDRNMS